VFEKVTTMFASMSKNVLAHLATFTPTFKFDYLALLNLHHHLTEIRTFCGMYNLPTGSYQVDFNQPILINSKYFSLTGTGKSFE
jgi:hypothetical protein